MESLLYGLKPRDPLTFVVAFIMVTPVSLAASSYPRGTASIAPMQALRMEWIQSLACRSIALIPPLPVPWYLSKAY